MGWGEELDVVALKAISHNLLQSHSISLNLPQSPSISHKLGRRGSQGGGDAQLLAPNLPQSPTISLNLPQAAAMPKESGSRPRGVVFTQGKDIS